MYPFFRFAKDMALARRQPRLAPFETHVSHHICWPSDIDIWMELNNGRTLTLYDLGRTMLAVRAGFMPVLRKNRWALAIAGSSIRYRRRIKAFDRFELRTRAIGWDQRFLYVEQGMWNSQGDCANHALLRSVVTGQGGIVAPADVIAAVHGSPLDSPALPQWVSAWCAAEDQRPWPPMTE